MTGTTAQRRLDEIERELEEIQHKTQDANLYIEHKRERIKEFEDAISNAKVEAASSRIPLIIITIPSPSWKRSWSAASFPPGSWRKS